MAAKTTDPIDILLEMGIDLDNLSEEEDYLSALMEATNALTIKNPDDPRIGPLVEEIKKVRKKRKESDPKFRVRRTTVSPDSFFDRKKPAEEQAKPVPGQLMLPGDASGALVKPDSLIPPEVDEDGEKIKKEPNILQDILNGVNSIIGILKSQNKLDKKRLEKNRLSNEAEKRKDAENKLEKGPLEKVAAGLKKIAKPIQNVFKSIFDFVKKVIIGRLLFKLIEWMGNPENGPKLEAIGNFLKNTWPALLAAYLLFGNSLGRFAVNLVKVVGGFAIKLLKTVIPQLISAVKKLGFKKSLGLGALMVGGGMLAGRVLDGGNDDVDLTQSDGRQGAPGSDVADGGQNTVRTSETITSIGREKYVEGQPMTPNQVMATQLGIDMGNPITGQKLKDFQAGKDDAKVNMRGGGKVPGSGPNKDTVPAMLAPGEFVMSRGAVQKYGTDTFAAMNAAGGGTNLPKRMNGITYAVGGGPMGSMNDYGYEEKNEEQSPTVKREMKERSNKSEGEEKKTDGGFFGGIKKFFGFGGSESGEDGKDGKNGEDASSGGFNESSLKVAMDAAGYTDPTERAMFLAQMAHESGNFRYDEEIHDGSNYEGRSDLGNTQPGDGRKYKGRGYIQLTGRANYRHYGNKLGVDLENNPELAKRPDIAAAVAVSYWNERVDRNAARAGDIRTVTYNINGGYNGLQDRISKFKKYSGDPNYTAPGGGLVAGGPTSTTTLSSLNNSSSSFDSSYGGITSLINAVNSGSFGSGSTVQTSTTLSSLMGSKPQGTTTTNVAEFAKNTNIGSSIEAPVTSEMGSGEIIDLTSNQPGASNSGNINVEPPLNKLPDIDAEAKVSQVKIRTLRISVG